MGRIPRSPKQEEAVVAGGGRGSGVEICSIAFKEFEVLTIEQEY